MAKLAKKPLKEMAKKLFRRLGLSSYFAETLIESLWRDDDEIVKELITEKINENNTALAPVLAGGFKESYLVDDITADTYTQLSSWFVLQPNELVGNFKAVVMVHDKVNNDIFTLQNVLTFDYTDALAEVELDSAVITGAPVTLALGIDGNKQLYALLASMHATDAKRIHFCFERCIVSSVMLDLAGVMAMELGASGELEMMLELAGTAGMGLGMEGEFESDVDPDAFITEWNMPAGDFTLPLGGGGSYDMEVDWGDGSPTSIITSYSDADKTHTYTESGTIRIKITGKCGWWYMSTSSISSLLLKIIQWGDVSFDYINGMCSNAVNLTEIPDAPITGVSSVVNASNLFRDCGSLQSIPSSLFDNLTLAENLYGVFSGCTSLQAIPSGLFDNNTEVTDLHFAFEGCTSLQSIPSDLFDNLTLLEDFSNVFDGCTSLQAIPSGLFDNTTAITNFSRAFVGTSIQSIPSGLFNYTTAVTNLAYLFYNCTSLQSIPSGLFDNCVLAENVQGIFYNCNSLQSIPSGLFDYTTAVTNFKEIFRGCTSVQSIPSGLFDNNVAAIDFTAAFDECTSMLSIPEDLYDNCISVTKFIRTHGANTSFSGNVPDLWNSHSGANGLQCFFGCTNALNYADIPIGWK